MSLLPSSDMIYAGPIGPWQVVLILLIVLLLFGGKKIPELMKGLGKGMKEFKNASKGETTDSPDKDTKIEEKKD
jgi:sec-independent protein translocase protein TatA